MFRKALSLFFGAYFALSLTGCNKPPMGPTPLPDPNVPIEILEMQVRPASGATLRPGTIVLVNYTIRCNPNTGYLTHQYTRDDGATMTSGYSLGHCMAGVSMWGDGIRVGPLGHLYKFGKGHNVTFRFAVVKDPAITDTSSGNVLFVSDEIATWFILNESPILFVQVNSLPSLSGVYLATVEIINGPNMGKDCTTKEDGGCMLANLQPGTFNVRVDHPNYKTAEKSARVGINEEVLSLFELSPK